MIQTTSDGVNCSKKLKLNGEQIWQITKVCTAIDPHDRHIWIGPDDSYSFTNGQIADFKFFTNDL